MLIRLLSEAGDKCSGYACGGEGVEEGSEIEKHFRFEIHEFLLEKIISLEEMPTLSEAMAKEQQVEWLFFSIFK